MNEASQLYTDGIITDADRDAIQQYEATKLFSLHWELRTILYIGILLFTSGIGILIYLNIDTIGHQTILALIAAAIGACFYYLVKHKQPYSDSEVKNVSPLFDYIGLLGCLLFATFIGYLQFQYKVFGHLLWLATLLPAALCFYSAYAFDHKGLLALGITGFISTMGLSIAPMQLLYNDDFADPRILFTATGMGLLLVAVALYSQHKNIKPHFSFTYHNFAATLLFVSALALLFVYPFKLLSFLWLAALCVYFVRYAIAQQSFLFLLYATVYSYIGLTYVVFSILLDDNYGDGAFVLGMLYIMASCVGVIFFFIKYKKILRLK